MYRAQCCWTVIIPGVIIMISGVSDPNAAEPSWETPRSLSPIMMLQYANFNVLRWVGDKIGWRGIKVWPYSTLFQRHTIQRDIAQRDIAQRDIAQRVTVQRDIGNGFKASVDHSSRCTVIGCNCAVDAGIYKIPLNHIDKHCQTGRQVGKSTHSYIR